MSVLCLRPQLLPVPALLLGDHHEIYVAAVSEQSVTLYGEEALPTFIQMQPFHKKKKKKIHIH